MNYFAHGLRFIDRPYFLAGTALPDWLSAVDRPVRLRSKRVEPFALDTGTPQAELAAGILQHLADDDWFHNTQAFASVMADLTRRFREVLPQDDSYRPAFLGHIVTELLIDGQLVSRFSQQLSAYYSSLASLDFALIEAAVNQMATKTTDRLAWFIPLFLRERFLADYPHPAKLFVRLNQVLRRVKLSELPPQSIAVLEHGQQLVGDVLPDLLPPHLRQHLHYL